MGILTVVFALLEMVGGFLLPCDATRPLLREQPERIVAANADTLEIPTVEEARQMIVGTWIEDVDGSIDGTKKGSKKWVFTEGGTVRKYRDGELYAKQDYEIVQRYDKMQDPDEIVGYLKFTRPSGEVYHATLMNVKRKRNPILIVSHHGAGATVFVPRQVFE